MWNDLMEAAIALVMALMLIGTVCLILIGLWALMMESPWVVVGLVATGATLIVRYV